MGTLQRLREFSVGGIVVLDPSIARSWCGRPDLNQMASVLNSIPERRKRGLAAVDPKLHRDHAIWIGG
jgi:hypothetical protein